MHGHNSNWARHVQLGLRHTPACAFCGVLWWAASWHPTTSDKLSMKATIRHGDVSCVRILLAKEMLAFAAGCLKFILTQYGYLRIELAIRNTWIFENMFTKIKWIVTIMIAIRRTVIPVHCPHLAIDPRPAIVIIVIGRKVIILNIAWLIHGCFIVRSIGCFALVVSQRLVSGFGHQIRDMQPILASNVIFFVLLFSSQQQLISRICRITSKRKYYSKTVADIRIEYQLRKSP